MNKNVFYRKIPKVDILLEEERIRQMICRYSKETVMESIRKETDRLRAFIGKCEDEKEIEAAIGGLTDAIGQTVEEMHTPNMRPVINGTGTILHTNLSTLFRFQALESP